MKFSVGEKASTTKTVSHDDIRAFSIASGDENPLHLDESYAKKTRFKKPIAHGMLVAGLISAVLGTKLPGPGTIYLGQTLRFMKPVFIGDTITAEVEVRQIRTKNSILILSTICKNQDDERVIEGEATVLFEGQ